MANKYDAELVARMVDAIRRAADEDYSSVIESGRNSEGLGQLVAEINNLLQRLDVRLTSRHRVEKLLELTQFAIDRAAIGCHWISSENQITYVNRQGL